MTQEVEENVKAFTTFRVLNGESDSSERDQLFRNMAQLYAFVSDRCDDEQVSQYDEVLCQLADLVEAEARAHVAKLLAPLDRAPGTVVVKLANDSIEVAQPLLEFSNVLSDDDLIEIVAQKTEGHRVAIAGREKVTDRVGDAIVEHGGAQAVERLVGNRNAELSQSAMRRLVERAAGNEKIAADLRGRTDLDWDAVRGEISAVGGKVLEQLSLVEQPDEKAAVGKVSSVVYNRMRNRAGFSANEWKMAWNQVKALSDRRQLDERALARFARFGYGHHSAAGLTVMLRVAPEVVVKWLATQDYVAMTVAAKALGLAADLFEATFAVMPWRDLPSPADKANVRNRYEALSREEASGIFELWRAHSFRRRSPGSETASAGVA
ncbi:MAG TPA: DUF2336 domain-containing protein [Devosiaceae bacterium]